MPLVIEIYVFTTEFCHEWHIVRRSRTNNKYSPLFKDYSKHRRCFQERKFKANTFLDALRAPFFRSGICIFGSPSGSQYSPLRYLLAKT